MYLRIIHVLVSAFQAILSVIIFSDLDDIEDKPERASRISESIRIVSYDDYIEIELIATFASLATAFFSGNKLLLIINTPMAVYNLYCFFFKNSRVYYSIGEVKENSKAFSGVSLRYKVKFILYGANAVISFLTFLIILNEDILRSLFRKGYIRKAINDIIGKDY